MSSHVMPEAVQTEVRPTNKSSAMHKFVQFDFSVVLLHSVYKVGDPSYKLDRFNSDDNIQQLYLKWLSNHITARGPTLYIHYFLYPSVSCAIGRPGRRAPFFSTMVSAASLTARKRRSSRVAVRRKTMVAATNLSWTEFR